VGVKWKIALNDSDLPIFIVESSKLVPRFVEMFLFELSEDGNKKIQRKASS